MKFASKLLVVAGLGLVSASAQAANVTLRNASWRPSVTIEVRAGHDQNCNQDAAQGAKQVPYGRSIKLQGGSVICVRREVDPEHPSGNWGQWTQYLQDIADDIQ